MEMMLMRMSTTIVILTMILSKISSQKTINDFLVAK